MTRDRRTTDPRKPPTDDSKDESQNGERTPFERFEDFVKKIAQVPKEEVDEMRAERERKGRAE